MKNAKATDLGQYEVHSSGAISRNTRALLSNPAVIIELEKMKKIFSKSSKKTQSSKASTDKVPSQVRKK